MALWGRDYFALDYARHFTGELAGIDMVDQRADVESLVRSGGPFYFWRPTFYLRPLDWWNARLGHAYLSSYEGDLLRVSDRPVMSDTSVPATHAVLMAPNIMLRDWQVKPLSDGHWLVSTFTLDVRRNCA